MYFCQKLRAPFQPSCIARYQLNLKKILDILPWWCNLRPTLWLVTVACCLILAQEGDDISIWANLSSSAVLAHGMYNESLTMCIFYPGLCQTVNLGLLRERGDLWQKCRSACRVQGSHPPRCCELCTHQHAQEQEAALCSQWTGRWVFIMAVKSVFIFCFLKCKNAAKLWMKHFQ